MVPDPWAPPRYLGGYEERIEESGLPLGDGTVYKIRRRPCDGDPRSNTVVVRERMTVAIGLTIDEQNSGD